jgi:hypothetical protein
MHTDAHYRARAGLPPHRRAGGVPGDREPSRSTPRRRFAFTGPPPPPLPLPESLSSSTSPYESPPLPAPPPRSRRASSSPSERRRLRDGSATGDSYGESLTARRDTVPRDADTDRGCTSLAPRSSNSSSSSSSTSNRSGGGALVEDETDGALCGGGSRREPRVVTGVDAALPAAAPPPLSPGTAAREVPAPSALRDVDVNLAPDVEAADTMGVAAPAPAREPAAAPAAELEPVPAAEVEPAPAPAAARGASRAGMVSHRSSSSRSTSATSVAASGLRREVWLCTAASH